MVRATLSNRTLAKLPAAVAVPSYDRATITRGIVHLGVGAFHRAHQSVYVDDCLASGETGWGIVGASLRSGDTRDALGPQDGLYTLAVRSSDGERLRVVGAIVALLVAPENPAALLEALCDPAIRIVTLTITEKAYLRNAAGGLDAAHPDIVHDLVNPGRPKTAHGFLTEALARRRAAGLSPFAVLCCDNLPSNGATLRRVMLDYAAQRDAGLARHIADDVAFPSSMVDRIVPATTNGDRRRIAETLGHDDAWPVMTEPFSQWVIEDRFPAGRPAWEKFGVTMVADVRPFEEMKLRLLNGSHSAIAYLGLLCGHATVAEAFADPAIRSFVERLWREAIPTLPAGAGLNPQDYVKQLARRYDNAALAHQTRQIANDGSQKLPQRIIAAALERLRDGETAWHLALVVAAWIAACATRGAALPAGHFTDPLDDPLGALLAWPTPERELVDVVFDLAGFAAGDSQREALVALVAAHLEILRENGAITMLASHQG